MSSRDPFLKHICHRRVFQSIRDRQLFAINGALAGVVLMVLVVWQVVAPHEVTTRVLSNEVCTDTQSCFQLIVQKTVKISYYNCQFKMIS